ncbi:hypothetical protein EV360DRAFT_37703 [Lentinula raphanica]|nr:hypothetical protein EV360DRAFT_37703 [Lentinula raphanica]
MLSVGVGGGSSLMAYDSSWQVWGSNSPSTQRDPSISSAASVGDIPSSQNETSYRGAIREGWTSSRPASGTWDEDVTQNPSKLEEFSQSATRTPLSLHPSRQRQASATSFLGPRAENRPAKLSPQVFDHTGNTDSNNTRFHTAPASASASFAPTPYSAPHQTIHSSPLTGASGYDNLISNTAPSTLEDLSLSFRGMAVEDDYSSRPRSSPLIPMSSGIRPQLQPPASLPRPSYNSYPGASDYAYGFDASRAPVDPSVYGSPALSSAPYPAMPPQGILPTPPSDHRQPNPFYDFPHRPPASPFYYPAQQGIMFPPPTSSSLMSPQLPHALLEKKRELSVSLLPVVLVIALIDF